MNIKDKLKKLDPSSHDSFSSTEKNPEDKEIVSILDGQLKKNKSGIFFKKKQRYELQYRHGLYPLQKIKNCNKKCFNYIFNNMYSEINYQDFLFIDTETTGLAGGTGTVPFMVGLGYFSADGFIVEQLFMRDYDEEIALLKELKDIMAEFPVVVSFNGKSYDLPLLKTRMVMNRCGEINLKNHLDLLHASRRIWSYLNSCSLTSLEEKILDITRNDYLPGSEVPGIYFNYLNSKEPKLLRPVFRHNLIDIISLVTLLNHLKVVYDSQSECDLNDQELFSLGKIYEKEKEIEKSIECYKKAKAETDSNYLQTQINKKLSWQYKRLDKWKEAVAIWKEMASEKKGGIFPLVELAKYYEHQTDNYANAIYCTKKALVYLKDRKRIITGFEQKRSKLEHRLERLRRKV